ncbi:unnamed protein product [Parnassius apollo]|uniref:(apollo) hypothetical protein n=1 Tax=Parnassius apollo TaxID=110799 RepID=A0A8S3XAT7_PARAO|nr:unnamed protein product [Parnassius apollo]
MSTHNHLATGEFTGPLGAKRAESEWQILRDILKEYGPDKAVEQWKQTWKDLKKGARIENAAAARGRSTTGNVATVPTVSEMGTKEIIEVSVVEHDTHSKLFEHTTAPSSFADELEDISPAPSNSLLAPSTSHPVPSTRHSAHSTRYATAQNKKERSHDVFNRLQQENNACLQSIDERLKKQNSLLCEQNQLLRAQNAHLGHRNKLERMKRFSQKFKF